LAVAERVPRRFEWHYRQRSKEEFVFNEPGLGEFAHRNDNHVLRDRDANTAWTTESDGTLEERVYYCHNFRGDVVALIADDGDMLEWVKYSAYGVPFGIPAGDYDGDWDCDTADVTAISTGSGILADLDLNGTAAEVADIIIASGYSSSSPSLGRGELSWVGNHKGYAGYEWDIEIKLNHVRNRVYSQKLGSWFQRDPEEYVDGLNMYSYCMCNPAIHTDVEGLYSVRKHRNVTKEKCKQAGLGDSSCGETCERLSYYASEWVDVDMPDAQDPKNAKMHCMATRGKDGKGPDWPTRRRERDIQRFMLEYKIESCIWDDTCGCEELLKRLGEYLHHEQDCQAPWHQHVDKDGVKTPRLWGGSWWGAGGFGTLVCHFFSCQAGGTKAMKRRTEQVLSDYLAGIMEKCCELPRRGK